MTAQVLQFVELSEADRKETGRLGELAKGDQIEVHIKRRGGAIRPCPCRPTPHP